MSFRLEYMAWWQAVALFSVMAVPIVLLGLRSMATLARIKRVTVMIVRLVVVAVAVMLLAGLTWERRSQQVELMVLEDASRSGALARNLPADSVRTSVRDYVKELLKNDPNFKADDRVGLIRFDGRAYVDQIPNTELVGGGAAPDPTDGTNVANAIQLGLATLGPDAMHRMLLVWDGNSTQGDLDAALAAAASRNVPIDVMPLTYNVREEVLVERVVAPTWRREGEPVTVEVMLDSNNTRDVGGQLTLMHAGQPLDMDPTTAEPDTSRRITLRPGKNVQRVRVPPMRAAGVHEFEAIFTPDALGGTGATGAAGDTLAQNNVASGFTFVRGKGKVLFVDNAPDNGGATLRAALAREGINVDPERTTVDTFPSSALTLNDYDSVILYNVPRGPGGLDEQKERQLAAYVHDLGGGLLMIGGPDSFGAGGWQSSKLEEVLPVTMDIPAQRQLPKGALVMILHSCEAPNGNYWGIQCAMKAIEVLNFRDEVGIISYDWNGGSAWDFPLAEKEDGSKPKSAAQNAQLGDMPDFAQTMQVALHGDGVNRGLKDSDARQKHMIIISDGDPTGPSPQLVQEYIDNNISVSTVSVFPHMGQGGVLPAVMRELAEKTDGRAYGPIEQNPSQLPQIFIKEATVVRRSLIFENPNGIPVKGTLSTSSLVRGIDGVPDLRGMVLTSAKADPQVELPLVAGENLDPVFAHWQTGLGKAAVFTGTADSTWAPDWVASPLYDKFWAQTVRGISRPAESSDFDIRVATDGGKGTVRVEALEGEGGTAAFRNFLNINGSVVGPDGKPQEIRLQQTGPGVYEAEFEANVPGNYVVGMIYRGNTAGTGGNAPVGQLRAGTSVNTSPELRTLQSNEAAIQAIARRTGGSVLLPFDPASRSLFDRTGLQPVVSPRPLWDWLLPALLVLMLMDVAIRRIAWDQHTPNNIVKQVVIYRDAFFGVRKVESGKTLEGLKQVRKDVAEARFKKPDRAVKFEATTQVQGDITQVVAGAQKAPPKSTDAGNGADVSTTSSLLEAKRRAREKQERSE